MDDKYPEIRRVMQLLMDKSIEVYEEIHEEMLRI